jgi:cell division protein FtsZ
MSIGEFEAVGDVIKSFSSPEANVVVGTVIDADMTDEMRVTVVLTGLSSKSDQTSKDNSYEGKAVDNGVDYQKLERPTVIRKQTPSHLASFIVKPEPSVSPEKTEEDMEYLDIPAFLRRKEKLKIEEET